MCVLNLVLHIVALVKQNILKYLCHKAINPSDKTTDYFVDFAVHSIILRLSGSRTQDDMQRSWCSNPAIGGEMLQGLIILRTRILKNFLAESCAKLQYCRFCPATDLSSMLGSEDLLLNLVCTSIFRGAEVPGPNVTDLKTFVSNRNHNFVKLVGRKLFCSEFVIHYQYSSESTLKSPG